MNPRRPLNAVLTLFLMLFTSIVWAGQMTYPNYTEQKVVYEFYFDHPQKIATALYWLKSHVKTLTEEPYGFAVDDLDIKVVIHGTEIVTLSKKNYGKYTDIVERMRYYAELGIDFRICASAAHDFGYKADDLQDFVSLVPSALVDLAHWQINGYALVVPKVFEKKFTTEEIR